MKNVIRKSVAALAFAALPFSAMAEDGVSDAKVVFGQAAALEGPAAALGTGMKTGLEAAFAEVNKAGGVHGPGLFEEGLDLAKAFGERAVVGGGGEDRAGRGEDPLHPRARGAQ